MSLDAMVNVIWGFAFIGFSGSVILLVKAILKWKPW